MAMEIPRRLPIVVLLLLLLGSPTARADNLSKARAHFARAETLYRLGKFDGALVQYQASYRQASLPRLLFNMAQCHRHLGQRKQALFYYTLFRDDWKRRFPGTRPPNDAEVMERIKQLQRELALSRGPAAPPAPASPPVVVKPAQRPTPVPDPPSPGARPPSAERAAPPASRLRRPWAWVAAGVGTAALGVGIGLLATRRVDEIVWSADGPPTRVTDSAAPGAVLVGAGAAAAALSCYLFVRSESAARVSLGPWGTGGFTASVWGRF